MKCGNCKLSHGTVNEVIACYHQAPRPKQAPHTKHVNGRRVDGGSAATSKQKEYVQLLLDQAQVEESWLKHPVADLTLEEADGAIKTLRQLRSPENIPPPESLPSTVQGEAVPDGTYTVVFNEESPHDRITLRFHSPRMGNWKGKQLVDYLYGPNNESDYRRFANRTNDGYRVWKKYRDEGSLVQGLKYMVGASGDFHAIAGHLFAMESSCCYRCGRKLTVPASIYRGLGPECAKIVGGA